MALINLTDVFDREIEILEIKAESMVYAIDRKDETKNKCVLERYDFNEGKITPLIELDYTRLYESFQTYGQNRDFFYAVNVLDDYRVRLRKIDKRTWKIGEDVLLDAEGEVLSLYILDESHLLVTDQVMADEAYVTGWGMTCGGRYMNLCYVYDMKAGKKYPVKDGRFHELLETVKIYEQGGQRVMLCIPGKEEVFRTDVGAFITSVKTDARLPFETVFKADTMSDGMLAFVQDGAGGFYGHVCGAGREKVLFFGADGKYKQICAYPYDEDGEYFYDPAGGHIFYCGSPDENGIKHLACMMDSMISLNISEDDGDFTGILTEEAYVTAFYREVRVKDDIEFREYAAIHYRDGRPSEHFAGRCIFGGGHIILMKSFLAL